MDKLATFWNTTLVAFWIKESIHNDLKKFGGFMSLPLNARKLSAALGASALLSLPALAFTHPGHGHHHHQEGLGLIEGLLHPITGVDHLLAALLIGAIAYHLGGQRRWELPAAFVGALLLGALLSLGGLALPAVHLFSAATVLLLGLFLAASLKFPRKAALAAASLFGLFHGGAHFETLSAFSLSTALYAGALILSTALLHTGGYFLAKRFFSTADNPPAPSSRFAGAAVACAGLVMITFQLL